MRRFSKITFITIFIFGFLTHTLLNTQESEKYLRALKEFEGFVVKQMKLDHIPGLSVGFIDGNYTWTKGFGYADLENKIPATAESSYRLASNSKSMAAAAILQLMEEGKLDLDAEVQRYVPYFPRKKWPVTVRQVLGHLGGITHYKERWELHIKEYKDTRDAIAVFKDYDLIAEPGTRYSYSSYGYNLLGAVVEGASKQAYGEYMREHIWNPLEMNDTYMDIANKIIPNRVSGYRLVDGELRKSEFIDVTSRFAGGGKRSTVIDMVKYVKGYRGGKILKQETIDMMLTSMTTADGRYTGYGMGWNVNPINGYFVASHGGSQQETRTFLIRFPTEERAIVIAYNFEGASPSVYAERLYQLMCGMPWNMSIYTGNRIDDALMRGMNDVFNYGLSYFERYGKQLSGSFDELKIAFNYFNRYMNKETLEADYGKTFTKIRDGRHPVSSRAFVKIGSYMAEKLSENYREEKFEEYHRMGAITFFNDFTNLYAGEEELVFDEAFESKVAEWGRSWEKTCTDYCLGLHIAPFSDVDEIAENLTSTFGDEIIYPDFIRQLSTVTLSSVLSDDNEKARKAAQLAVDLYPASATPYVDLGLVHICTGDEEKGLSFFRKAHEINPNDYMAGPAGLARLANQLVYGGKRAYAMSVLETALELYPDEARVLNGIAGLYMLKAEKWYEKALEADPMNEGARENLKKIKE